MKGSIIFFVLSLILGCSNHQKTNQSSELAQLMARMDAKARVFQNRNFLSHILSKFEGDSKCSDVAFEAFVEPGNSITSKSTLYSIEAKSEQCGKMKYTATVYFKDNSRTVVQKLENIVRNYRLQRYIVKEYR